MWRLFLILTFAILQTAIGTDYIFQWAGWMPQSHGMQIGMRKEGIQWNYKTVLNLIFIPLSVIGFFYRKENDVKDVDTVLIKRIYRAAN
jgi:hypothetical protein